MSKHFDDTAGCSISLAETVKTSDTEETEPITVLGSDDDLHDDDLDELEKELLNWAAEEKLVPSKSNRKAASKSAPSTSVRSPVGPTRKRVTRTKSAGDIKMGRQKSFENRLRRALTLNSYEQEQKKEEDSCVEASMKKNQQHPEERLKQLLHGVSAKTFQSETWENYFNDVTPERVAAHSLKVDNAIRKGDLERLQKYHANGVSLDSCNKHGESMIHLACRLGNFDIVKSLVEDAKVPVRVQDDCGKTPMHEACWTPNPDFKLIQFIVNKAPELLFVSDKRGFNPLRYIPKSCWDDWCDFFQENLTFLRLKINHSKFLSAHCQLDDAQERLQALMRRAEKFSSAA